jgi:hypothetical protein
MRIVTREIRERFVITSPIGVRTTAGLLGFAEFLESLNDYSEPVEVK